LKLSQDRQHKLFYGYIVVAAGFVLSVLILGVYLTFGVAFKPLSLELGWARAPTAAAQSIAVLAFGLSSIAAGRLTDKYGPRLVLIACGIFMGVGSLLMSRVTTFWQLYLFHGVMIGSAMSGSETPIIATVARWFVKRRGMMVGIAKAGAGVGMMMPLLASWLIYSYGWRNAYVFLGIIALVGIISIALLYKRDPSQIGEQPYGATEVETTELSINARQFSMTEVMGIRQFWIFSAIWFNFLFCVQIFHVHTIPHVTDLGISPTIAAGVISVAGGLSILSRLGFGALSDKIGVKSAHIIALSFLVASFVLLQFAREVWMLYLFGALYGTGHGAIFTMITPMTAWLFGLRSLGTILGAIFFIATFGGLIGPVLAGRIFDVTGSYQPVFIACMALNIVSIILMLFLRPTSNEALREIR